MDEVGLIVLGSIVGALATGGVSAWETWSRRRTDVRVAARVVLGDLYVMEGLCEIVLARRVWPDRLDVKALVDGMTRAWLEQRAAFARGVGAWEWTLVDGVYSNLVRTIPEHGPGQACTDSDITSVEGLRDSIPRAREIVLERAADKRERDELVKQLTQRAKP